MMRVFLMLGAMIGVLLTAPLANAADEMPAGVKANKLPIGVSVLADAKGMTLYTYDNDKGDGKSVCNGQCAQYWPPLAAAADAKPVGAWTVVTRDDGSKQWAYKSKPLYTFVQDKQPGDTTGNDMGPNGTKVWHCALP